MHARPVFTSDATVTLFNGMAIGLVVFLVLFAIGWCCIFSGTHDPKILAQRATLTKFGFGIWWTALTVMIIVVIFASLLTFTH